MHCVSAVSSWIGAAQPGVRRLAANPLLLTILALMSVRALLFLSGG